MTRRLRYFIRAVLVALPLLLWVTGGMAYPYPPPGYPYQPTSNQSSEAATATNQAGVVLRPDPQTQQKINKFFDKALYKNFQKKDDDAATDFSETDSNT